MPPHLATSLTEPLTCAPLAVNPRRTRVAAAGAGVVIVLGGGGTVAGSLVGSQVYGPEAAAGDYFRAVADGRADDALGLLDDAPSGQPLLTDSALAFQRRTAPLRHIKVSEVESSGTTATVTVEYTVRGASRQTRLSMVADEEHKHLGLWPRWKVMDGLAAVTVDGPSLLEKARVNGRTVPLTDGSAGQLSVFPGAVTVEGVDSGYLDATGGGTLTVDAGAAEAVDDLDVSLSAEGARVAREAVVAELTTCASVTTVLEPEGCPMSVYDYSEVSDVRWTNRSFPEPQTELDEDGAVTVSGDLDCAVTYTSTGLFGDDAPQEIKDEDTSTYWASVDLSAPSPVVTFNQ